MITRFVRWPKHMASKLTYGIIKYRPAKMIAVKLTPKGLGGKESPVEPSVNDNAADSRSNRGIECESAACEATARSRSDISKYNERFRKCRAPKYRNIPQNNRNVLINY